MMLVIIHVCMSIARRLQDMFFDIRMGKKSLK